jgi:hypothetical protein
MLHLEDCEHFLDEQPPRPATAKELVTLLVCNSCAGRSGKYGRTSGHVPNARRTETFVCEPCYVRYPIRMRAADGRCRDCTG